MPPIVQTESERPNENERPENSDRILTYPYKSSTEYSAAVNQWLWQCYHWQCLNFSFPYYLSMSAVAAAPNVPGGVNRNVHTAFPTNVYVGQSTTQIPRSNAQQGLGIDYVIPPLWKRFAAEMIDFFILLLLKVMVTYIALDFFDLINLEKYDLEMMKNGKLDYRKAMEVTSEIIALEVVHRFAVCIFEAVCMHRGILGIGGATPGKNFMKIKVVSCQTAMSIDMNRVRVYPAGDLGFFWAFLRAFIKNFSLAFIFPICFTMFFFQHNRTAYDIICNSIVVEENPPRMQRN